MQNKAVVVGALGVIGRYIAEKLVEEAGWQVVGLSRRKAVEDRLYKHNSYATGRPDGQGLGFVIRNEAGQMIGVAPRYAPEPNPAPWKSAI